MTTKSYIGDTGTIITLDCGTDVSSATARSIFVRKPDLTTTTWTAIASGTDSISFTTLAGTLDQSGTWLLQARVTLPSGQWLGETAKLQVHKPYR